MRLKYDLHTIYGSLLVRKNKQIAHNVVRRIKAAGARHDQGRMPLEGSDIFADFKKVFEDDRYVTMFKPPVSTEEILKAAGSLKLENDLMLELNNMKRNMPYTYTHVLIVAAFSIKLSLAYHPKNYASELAAHCGFTHDIGKTRIPGEILDKKEALTDEESRIIKTHPVIGYLLLSYYLKRDRRICALASLDHHERLDGSGYPNRIRSINKYTQLISAVDVMDALMTKRPYREKAYSLRATLDYLLMEAKNKRLNRNIVYTLISFARKEKPDMRTMKISRHIREALPEQLTHDKYR